MVWLDLAIVTCCGVAGLICGWVVHSLGGLGNGVFFKPQSLDQGWPQVSPVSTCRGESQFQDESQFQGEARCQDEAQAALRLEGCASSIASDMDVLQPEPLTVSQSRAEALETSHELVIRAVSELIEANEAMQTQLKQAHDRIHRQAAQIESAERRAQTDALTRIPNRRAFDKHIQQRAKLGAAKAGTLALLDVDDFKKFNDIHGHQAGDEVLRIVAKIVHSRLRSYGLVARFGGEEFAILLDGIPIHNAKSLVERARLAVGEREIPFENKVLRVTASIGLAEHAVGESIVDWIQRADSALYYSKKAGRDCGHWMEDGSPVRIASGRRCLLSSSPAMVPFDRDQSVVEQGDHGPRADLSGDELLDVLALESIFDQLRRRILGGTSMVIMAIRCHGDIEPSVFRSLSQVVRAAVRGVDRIGIWDPATLVVCMPSVELAMAAKRARQICRSAESIGLQEKGRGPRPLSIGYTEVVADERFADVVSRSLEAADQARDAFSEPLAMAPCPLSSEQGTQELS